MERGDFEQFLAKYSRQRATQQTNKTRKEADYLDSGVLPQNGVHICVDLFSDVRKTTLAGSDPNKTTEIEFLLYSSIKRDGGGFTISHEIWQAAGQPLEVLAREYINDRGERRKRYRIPHVQLSRAARDYVKSLPVGAQLRVFGTDWPTAGYAMDLTEASKLGQMVADLRGDVLAAQERLQRVLDTFDEETLNLYRTNLPWRRGVGFSKD